jgi:hypothetical protein
MNVEQFIETWQIHNRISLYMLDAVQAENLAAVSGSKGRTVGESIGVTRVIKAIKDLVPPFPDRLLR